MSLKHCTLAHPSRGIHRGAESAPAAATAASSCASTGNAIVFFFFRVNHGFLTMRGMWRDCGKRFSEAETQSHARTVSRESPHLCLWSHVQRVPAVSVWQHCRPADTGDSLLTMPHRSKKDKVKLFSWVSCLSRILQDSLCCVYCLFQLLVFVRNPPNWEGPKNLEVKTGLQMTKM